MKTELPLGQHGSAETLSKQENTSEEKHPQGNLSSGKEREHHAVKIMVPVERSQGLGKVLGSPPMTGFWESSPL